MDLLWILGPGAVEHFVGNEVLRTDGAKEKRAAKWEGRAE